MSIPKACVEAVIVLGSRRQSEQVAGRVILALAENLPEDAVEKAVTAWLESASDYTQLNVSVSTAIAAFLKHVAGEAP